ncbi:hypothetical protein DMUE_0906 [Dictyocoela muelleri]|nr:hypothetical protein DMUE_0906 [Dictyocoela muelleri]
MELQNLGEEITQCVLQIMLECLKYTYANELFLYYDSGINDPERVLIFTTETHLLHLKSSQSWNCDGTFWSYPRDYCQIYVILAKVRTINIPLVYFIMKTRSKSAYEKIFNFLKNKINDFNQKFITIDFEMAAYLTLKNTFPKSKIVGCFFHFTQLLFRRVQRLELVKLYKENIRIREVFRMIIALAFVPIHNVKCEYLKLMIISKIIKNSFLSLHFGMTFILLLELKLKMIYLKMTLFFA